MVVHRVYFISKYYLQAGCDFNFLIPNLCAIFFKISLSHVLLKNALSSIISLLSFDLSSTPSFRKKCPHCGIVYPFFSCGKVILLIWHCVELHHLRIERTMKAFSLCQPNATHQIFIVAATNFHKSFPFRNSPDSQGSQRNPHISLMPGMKTMLCKQIVNQSYNLKS